ncbi:MAG: type II toxin-antitoxin system VapC family toxin [Thermoleophilaceae bacterium]
MARFLYDTNVFVYALGGEHPYREPCRAILRGQGEGALAGEVTTVLLAELAHQRFRQTRDRSEAALRARETGRACLVHEVAVADGELALELYRDTNALDAFDALLAAVGLNRDVTTVVSADRAFDALEGLTRIDPLDEAGLRSLAG